MAKKTKTASPRELAASEAEEIHRLISESPRVQRDGPVHGPADEHSFENFGALLKEFNEVHLDHVRRVRDELAAAGIPDAELDGLCHAPTSLDEMIGIAMRLQAVVSE